MRPLRLLWLLLPLCHLLGTTCAAQQFVDLAKVYYSTSPYNHFENSTQTSHITEFGGEVLLPVVLKNEQVILTGLAFDKTTVKPGIDKSPIELYTINPRIGASLKHSEHWGGQYVLLPQIASDLQGPLTMDDVQLGIIGVLNYNHRKNLSYRFGAYYSTSLTGPGIFVIAGFYYQNPNARWTFDFTMPVWGDVNYKISERWSAGLRYDGMVRSYYLHEPPFTDGGEYLVKLSPEIYGYLQLAVAKNYILQLKVGHSIGRSYRVFENGDRIDLGFTGLNFGDKRKQLNTDFEDGFIFQLRLHYRFFLKTDNEAK